MKWLLPWLAAVVVAGGVVLAVNSMTGEEPLQVRSVTVGKNSRDLEVTYLGPPPECDAPTRVSVEESDQTVEIRAWAGRGDDGPARPSRACSPPASNSTATSGTVWWSTAATAKRST